MHPSYTIFNRENKNFSVIWTEFHQEYNIFLSNYEKDVAQYSCSRTLAPKSEKPANTFDVSMIPWDIESKFFNPKPAHEYTIYYAVDKVTGEKKQLDI